MSQYSLVYPMATLVLLTFAVMMLMLFNRIQAVRSKKVPGSYYRLMQGDKEPTRLVAMSRNYKNLYEAPVLFYVVCVLVIALNRVDDSFIYLAWAFVGLRLLHSLIHVSYNHVLHRLAAYAASFAVMSVMWIRLVLGA